MYILKTEGGVPAMVQCVKNLTECLVLLGRCRFNPCPRNFCMLWVSHRKLKIKIKKCRHKNRRKIYGQGSVKEIEGTPYISGVKDLTSPKGAVNVRQDTIKLLEENAGKHSLTSTKQMFSLGQSPKAIEIKTKINQ